MTRPAPSGSRLGPALVAALLLSGVAPGPARAQQGDEFEVAPRVGVLVPTATLARGTVTRPGGDPIALSISQETGLLVGARITAWWSGTWGWEADFGHAFSNAEVEGEGVGSFCGGDEELECSANVWVASSRLLWRLLHRSGAPGSLYASLGVTVVGHTGTFWRRGEATTDLGLVAGLGGAVELSRRFALRLDVEDHAYRFRPEIRDDPEIGTVSSGQRLQNDLVVSAGLSIRLPGR